MISYRFQFALLVLFAFKVVTGYTYQRNIPKPQEGLTPCEEDADCSNFKNSTCQFGLCKCSDNDQFVCEEIESNGVLVTKLGMKCESSADCNIEKSHCHAVKKVCVCDESTVAATDRRKCLEISTGIGAGCTESVQCYTKTPSTGCRGNKCVCRQGMYEKNGTCYQTVDLDGRCANDEDCRVTDFSRCLDFVCSCDDGYMASGSRCLRIAKVQKDDCEEDVQCTRTLGGGAHCLENICQCKDLYHYKSSSNRCVRDLLLGDICTNHSDCHQPGQEESRLECLLWTCSCRSIYREVNGYCISSASRLFSKEMHLFFQLFISYVLLAMFLL